MMYLLVGRTGSGKDTFRESLESNLGWKFVKSYTTRNPRYPEEDTHIFVSHEEADSYKDKVAQTFISNGNGVDEYFATKDQMNENDAYIIDPIGLYQMLDKGLETEFTIIYIYSPSKLRRYSRCLARNGVNPISMFKLIKRLSSEENEFNLFEKILEEEVPLQGVVRYYEIENNYDDQSIEEGVKLIQEEYHQYL